MTKPLQEVIDFLKADPTRALMLNELVNTISERDGTTHLAGSHTFAAACMGYRRGNASRPTVIPESQDQLLLEEVVVRELCGACWDEELTTWFNLTGGTKENVFLRLSAWHLKETKQVQGVTKRLQAKRVVTSKRIVSAYSHLDALEETLKFGTRTQVLDKAHQGYYDHLVELAGVENKKLMAVIQTPERQELVKERVTKELNKRPDLKPETEHGMNVVTWYATLKSTQDNQSQLVLDCLLAYGAKEKGVHVMVKAPKEVANYLDWAGSAGAARTWFYPDIFKAPEDDILDLAFGLWDPAGNGRMCSFGSAIEAAELIHEQ